MAKFHFRATTSKSTSDVVEFFADMTNAASWDPSISSVVRLDEGPVAQGSSFRVTLGFLGRDLVLTYRVTTLTADRVVLRAETGLFVSEDTVDVASSGTGTTTLVYEARLAGKGAAALLDPFFRLSINHFGKQAGEQLRNGYLR